MLSQVCTSSKCGYLCDINIFTTDFRNAKGIILLNTFKILYTYTIYMHKVYKRHTTTEIRINQFHKLLEAIKFLFYFLNRPHSLKFAFIHFSSRRVRAAHTFYTISGGL